MVAFLGLVHLWIVLPLLILSPPAQAEFTLVKVDGSGDQSAIGDRALLHGHADGLEMAFDHLEDLLAEIVLLKLVVEGEDRSLMRDPVTDHVDPNEAPHGCYLD